MANLSLGKLNKINYNTSVVAEQMEFLRNDIKNGLKKLTAVTQKLDKDYHEPNPGAWKIVKEPTPSERYPLVQSDTDQLLKKLDIL